MTTFGEHMERLQRERYQRQHDLDMALMHAIDVWENDLSGLRSDLYHSIGPGQPTCSTEHWHVETIRLMGECLKEIREAALRLGVEDYMS